MFERCDADATAIVEDAIAAARDFGHDGLRKRSYLRHDVRVGAQ